MKKFLTLLLSILLFTSAYTQVSHAAFVFTQTNDSIFVGDWIETDPEFSYNNLIRYIAPDTFLFYVKQVKFNSFDSLSRTGSPRSQVWLDQYGNLKNSPIGANGQIQKSNGSSLIWFTPTYITSETDPLFNTNFLTKTTTDLSEGTNLYYSTARFDARFSIKTTDNLNEGSTNLYWTNTRFNTAFSGKSTNDLVEGTSLYFTNSRGRSALSAGNGISYNSSTGVISRDKRQETYSGTTNSSGNYTVSFGTSYSVTPNIQANIINGSNTNLIKITSISTTGFTVNVVNRTDVIGLLPSYTNVNSSSVDILITEK